MTTQDDRPGETMLDPDQAARFMGVGKSTLMLHVRLHEIHHVHVGRLVRFDRDALRRGDPPTHTHAQKPPVKLPAGSYTIPAGRQKRSAAGR